MPTPSKPQDRKPRKASAATQSRSASGVAAARSVPLTPEHADAAADPYAPTAWGKIGGTEDIVCPSGQRALVRRPGVQGLILAGALEEMDSLSAIVDEKHIKRVKGEEEIDVASLMTDPEQIQRVLAMADRVVAYVVVKPALTLPPADEAEREDGVLYTDMVDLEDRMFLMNYAVGGTRDIETFHAERDASLGGVGSVDEVLVQAK